MFLLDLFAAFDTVAHIQVLTGLEDIGITGVALDWFCSYPE